MLANFFGKSKPVNFVFIVVLFLMYYFSDFLILKRLQIERADFYGLLAVFPLFLGVFFFFNFIVSKNELTQDNSFAFLFFVLGIGFLEKVILDVSIVLELIVLLLFLRKVYSFRTLKSVFQKLFDAGFWLGILCIVSPYYLIYLVLLYASVFFFLKITIRAILIPIVGFIAPVFLYFTYCFWYDDVETFYQLFTISIQLNVDFLQEVSNQFFVIIFGLFTFVAILLRSGRIFSISNEFKRSWMLLLFHLFLAVLFLLTVNNINGGEMIAVLIPATIIIANWLETVGKKLIVNGVLLLLLVLSFAIHFIA